MASAQHSRKPSSRAALPRRTTKGPLDAPDDPLAASGSSLASPSSRASPLPRSPLNETNEPLSPAAAAEATPAEAAPLPPPQPDEASEEERDLSFLLDASIYHPISQLEVPGPFRKPFIPPPTGDKSLSQCLEQLDSLLAQCDFLRAAHLTGSILISGTVRPTDAKTVFQLLGTRYSCLELSGNTLLAAQEAKALEDLSSAFYYDDLPPKKTIDEEIGEQPRKVPHHIMPFSLRLQALRLQSIGFSDTRRGVSTLYDTALECREYLSSPATSAEERALWTDRLQEVSVRVANALIDMGDLDCAARTLETMKPGKPEEEALWTTRMVLLRIKMGDISKARRLIESSTLSDLQQVALGSLLAIAEGRFKDASKALSESSPSADPTTLGLLKQNLAVAYLYEGEVRKSREILEELVKEGYSFQTLTVNLATIYDLSSDRSRDLKMSIVSQIASQQKDSNRLHAFVNADFKL